MEALMLVAAALLVALILARVTAYYGQRPDMFDEIVARATADIEQMAATIGEELLPAIRRANAALRGLVEAMEGDE